MTRMQFVLSVSLSVGCAIALPAAAQNVAVAARAPRTIVIRLVDQPGPKPFAFSPSAFSAVQGDTLKFVQASATMHNVHFKSQPKGAKLGGAGVGPYFTSKGQTYTLVVGPKFAPGNYEIVCDPHEIIGMHGYLTVLSYR